MEDYLKIVNVLMIESPLTVTQISQKTGLEIPKITRVISNPSYSYHFHHLKVPKEIVAYELNQNVYPKNKDL